MGWFFPFVTVKDANPELAPCCCARWNRRKLVWDGMFTIEEEFWMARGATTSSTFAVATKASKYAPNLSGNTRGRCTWGARRARNSTSPAGYNFGCKLTAPAFTVLCRVTARHMIGIQ